MTTICLDKAQIILTIRANPADPAIYEVFYCPECRLFVAANGPFPPPLTHGHALARLPGLDTSFPVANQLVLDWLESYKLDLAPARYQQLLQEAGKISSNNWVWILQGVEQKHWLAYLDKYLDYLAEVWLSELNAEFSSIWLNLVKMQPYQFEWSLTKTEPTSVQDFLNLSSLFI